MINKIPLNIVVALVCICTLYGHKSNENCLSFSKKVSSNLNIIEVLSSDWIRRFIPLENLLSLRKDITGITYLVDDKLTNFSKYSNKRYEYLRKKMEIGHGLPQTVINHQKVVRNFINNEDWINQIYSKIKSTKKLNMVANNVYFIKKYGESNQQILNTFSCLIKESSSLNRNAFSKLRYHLLLIANDYQNSVADQTNVVYDMILLEGDSQDIFDTYDGTGFLIDTEERKNNYTFNGFYLKSKSFTLPKVDGIYYGWSLQLILEDPGDPSNYVYAWHFPIPEE